jgi:hypothetical protein
VTVTLADIATALRVLTWVRRRSPAAGPHVECSALSLEEAAGALARLTVGDILEMKRRGHLAPRA